MEPPPNLETTPLRHALSVTGSIAEMFAYPLRASHHYVELVNQ